MGVRGRIWQLLVHHARATEADSNDPRPKPDLHSDFPVDTPYEELLKQLTAQQHAILIDLGECCQKPERHHCASQAEAASMRMG